MDDNKRNEQTPANDDQRSESQTPQGDQQNVSNEGDQNPQQGHSWNNYRTREMSSDDDQNSRSTSGEISGGGNLY